MQTRTREVLELSNTAQVPASPLVFPSRDGLKPASLAHAWALARERAQLDDFRFHDLRHTAASYLALSGGGRESPPWRDALPTPCSRPDGGPVARLVAGLLPGP